MRVWITCDSDWALCLWRVKPFLNGGGCWWDDDEEFDDITEDIYYSLTNYRDLPKNDELIEIEVDVTSKDSNKEHIKNRRHK